MLAFRKMHGLGNDFVVLDARTAPILLPEARVRLIGDRRRGIGFDQLLVLEPAHDDSADIFMRIFNPDGSEAGACGNGTRCVAHLLMEEADTGSCIIETRRGLLSCRRQGDFVSVDMGEAMLDWQDVPLSGETDTLHLPIQLGPLSDPAAVGMGNPHCIFIVDDAEAHELETLGPAIEHHPMFPERTNVELVSIRPDGSLRLRVWERGAGVTLACGSGTCATVVAAHRRGLVNARDTAIPVHVDGGLLEIQWRDDGHVIMTGPVATAFVGEAEL